MNWIGIFRVATVGATAALVLALSAGRAFAAVPTEQEMTQVSPSDEPR